MKKDQPIFTKEHHDIYNQLRTDLMNLHAKGVPGMDQMVQTLDKIHMGHMAERNKSGQGGGNPFVSQNPTSDQMNVTDPRESFLKAVMSQMQY